MRVALHAGQLRQSVPGGIGRYVVRLAQHLPAAGVEPICFGSGPRPDRLPDGPEWYDLGAPRGALRYELWHRFRAPAIPVRADVVHATSLAVPPAGGRPLVVSIHDVAFLRHPEMFTRRGRLFHRRGLALARRHADAVITASEFTRQELIRERFDAARIHAIPHGAERPENQSDEEASALLGHVGVEEPFVLSVGTIEPRKNFGGVVAAVRELRRRGLDLSLVVAGARGWGARVSLREPWIRETGEVDDLTLDALYRCAALCCQLSTYEGFGLPALEAMARGCPVVVPPGGALAEVVGAGGTIARDFSADAVADAALALVSDSATRDAAARAALTRARDFSWQRSAERHAEVYRSV